MSQDHLGNLQWPSMFKSSDFFFNIISISSLIFLFLHLLYVHHFGCVATHWGFHQWTSASSSPPSLPPAANCCDDKCLRCNISIIIIFTTSCKLLHPCWMSSHDPFAWENESGSAIRLFLNEFVWIQAGWNIFSHQRRTRSYFTGSFL